MRKSVYLVAVLTMISVYLQYEVLIYQAVVPVLLWSNNTLNLNVAANRRGWHVCRDFGICGDVQAAPPRKARWRGEVAFRG
jgi:hypothetical protein